jgi:hypothetical protein
MENRIKQSKIINRVKLRLRIVSRNCTKQEIEDAAAHAVSQWLIADVPDKMEWEDVRIERWMATVAKNYLKSEMKRKQQLMYIDSSSNQSNGDF